MKKLKGYYFKLKYYINTKTGATDRYLRKNIIDIMYNIVSIDSNRFVFKSLFKTIYYLIFKDGEFIFNKIKNHDVISLGEHGENIDLFLKSIDQYFFEENKYNIISNLSEDQIYYNTINKVQRRIYKITKDISLEDKFYKAIKLMIINETFECILNMHNSPIDMSELDSRIFDIRKDKEKYFYTEKYRKRKSNSSFFIQQSFVDAYKKYDSLIPNDLKPERYFQPRFENLEDENLSKPTEDK